jgi:hypothetical protein
VLTTFRVRLDELMPQYLRADYDALIKWENELLALVDELEAVVCEKHEASAKDDLLWIEARTEHRHASPRAWCAICDRIDAAMGRAFAAPKEGSC